MVLQNLKGCLTQLKVLIVKRVVLAVIMQRRLVIKIVRRHLKYRFVDNWRLHQRHLRDGSGYFLNFIKLFNHFDLLFLDARVTGEFEVKIKFRLF